MGNDEFVGRFTIGNTLSNSFVRVVPDKLAYGLNERAQINVLAGITLQNPEMEAVVSLFVNGEEQYPRSGNPQERLYVLPLKERGEYTLVGQAYQQNKRLGRDFEGALSATRKERDEIRRRLEDGVDEDTREDLEKRLVYLESRMEKLKAELAKIRFPIGNPVSEVIYVE